MANEIIRTRSGLTPDERTLPFTVTTLDVEDYLQKKMDVVCNGIARNTGNAPMKIDVKVQTIEAGTKFIPFVVVLPLTVLKENKKNDNDIPSIFNPRDEDRTANMQDPFYHLFKCYIYNKDDESAFFAEDWRRARGVSRETSPFLKTIRTPKIMPADNGNMDLVYFMIDPLRVFYDMLSSTDSSQTDFRIEISSWQKIKNGEFKYFVKREIFSKKSKKYKNTIIDELNRKMRGNR